MEQRYQMSFALFGEYRAYENDSAIGVIWIVCIALAERMERSGERQCYIAACFSGSTIGDYVESYSLLNKMDTTKLDAEGYRNYLWAGQHLYGRAGFL